MGLELCVSVCLVLRSGVRWGAPWGLGMHPGLRTWQAAVGVYEWVRLLRFSVVRKGMWLRVREDACWWNAEQVFCDDLTLRASGI